ncbi:hypothetical protein C1H46_003792 [Malus baccata]|uniref:Uncharacterized protein n=1 Tax=Malus baccata TaxID=106549 RepID=A0A540NHQ5_MALBA|nr:hypothetical protein C1H46_003792 [Malus baccata]
MAPRKRKTTEQEEKQLVAQDSGQRVTRSMARPAPSGSSAEPRPVAPARKKAKGAQKKKERAKKEEVEAEEAEAVKEEEDNSGESKAEADAENENKKKKGKEKVEAEAENKEEKGKAKVEDDGEGTEADDDELDKRTIVIEHCKQCKSFKVRADQVKNGLEKGVPGIKVLLNPDKPRKGCLEIREEGGETFLSLLDMKRPFSKMKALNMEEVISDIIEKIK